MLESLLSLFTVSSSSHGRILVADADRSSLSTVCHALTELGYAAQGVSSAQAAKHTLQEQSQEQSYDIFLYDSRLTADDETFAFKTGLTGKAPVVAIMMAEPGTEGGTDTAVFELVSKPVRIAALKPVLARAMQVRRLRLENQHLRESVAVYTQGAQLYKEALEAAQHTKTDFLATVSHELRTPLNTILGYIGLLREGEFGRLAAAQETPLQRVHACTQRVLDLVSFLLAANRLEAGQLFIDRHEVGLNQLLQDVQTETQESCEQAGLRLDWRVVPGLPPVHTDPDKLQMVLKSLTSNAVKFTEHGTVTVEISPSAGGIQIRVTDTGIGIPSESLEVIFELFQQLDGALTRSYEGTGLGLYMARRLTELLGGAVSVESEVGHGSTFRVWLPLSVD